MSKKCNLGGRALTIMARPKPDVYVISINNRDEFLKEKMSGRRKSIATKMAEEFKQKNLRK